MRKENNFLAFLLLLQKNYARCCEIGLEITQINETNILKMKIIYGVKYNAFILFCDN